MLNAELTRKNSITTFDGGRFEIQLRFQREIRLFILLQFYISNNDDDVDADDYNCSDQMIH